MSRICVLGFYVVHAGIIRKGTCLSPKGVIQSTNYTRTLQSKSFRGAKNGSVTLTVHSHNIGADNCPPCYVNTIKVRWERNLPGDRHSSYT